MQKPITGQYECVHRSGIGLDYFTSRVDRLTVQQNGRFILIVQDSSRVANVAQSLINGQQAATNAPETRREGSYSIQGNVLTLRFDDGAREEGQLAWNGEGLQLGPNFFNKVSDSTLLPPTHRIKKDMDDIARGLKIASTIGGMAMKAAKTIHDTIQTTQEPGPASTATPGQAAVPPGGAQPGPAHQPQQQFPPAQPTYTPPPPPTQEALFCDQCGTRARPGKRFCNNCGAQLP